MRYSCVFCVMTKHYTKDTEKIARVTHDVYAITPLHPVVQGHTLFVHEIHTTSPSEDGMVFADVAAAAAFWVARHHDADYNLIVNAGAYASQTMPHMHMHFVPRTAGDGLHLPWTGQIIHEGDDE